MMAPPGEIHAGVMAQFLDLGRSLALLEVKAELPSPVWQVLLRLDFLAARLSSVLFHICHGDGCSRCQCRMEEAQIPFKGLR
jgi:hypothetical protein